MSDDIAGTFHALSDPTRVAVLGEVAFLTRASASSRAVRLPDSRRAIAKHMPVLADAGLVEARRDGRAVLYRVRREPLDDAKEWLLTNGDRWERRLQKLKSKAETG